MGVAHLIVPLREALDHGEQAWLEEAGIVAASTTQGRYPSRSELLQLVHRLDLSEQYVKEAPDQLSIDFTSAARNEQATVSISFEPSGVWAEHIVYRGHHAPVAVFIRALENICGGPFLVVLNGEQPVLAHLLNTVTPFRTDWDSVGP